MSADVILHRSAFPGGKVWKSERKGLAFGATDTTKSYTFQCNGKVNHVLVEIPNFSNAVTTTVTVADENGVTIMSKSGLAKATNHVIDSTDDFDRALAGTYTITLTLSGAPGGTGGTVSTTFSLV